MYVGTPGSLANNINCVVNDPSGKAIRETTKAIHVDKLRVFVLDEADEFLHGAGEGATDTTLRIREALPSTCRILLFSATKPPATIKYLQNFLRPGGVGGHNLIQMEVPAKDLMIPERKLFVFNEQLRLVVGKVTGSIMTAKVRGIDVKVLQIISESYRADGITDYVGNELIEMGNNVRIRKKIDDVGFPDHYELCGCPAGCRPKVAASSKSGKHSGSRGGRGGRGGAEVAESVLEWCTCSWSNREWDIQKGKVGQLKEFYQELATGKSIVFCSTTESVDMVKEIMETLNCKSSCIHAGLHLHSLRDDALDDFAIRNKTSVLISTDCLARGVDIPTCNFVVNFDLPYKRRNEPDCEKFAHRIARTARAEKRGVVVNFVSGVTDENNIRTLESMLFSFYICICVLFVNGFFVYNNLLTR